MAVDQAKALDALEVRLQAQVGGRTGEQRLTDVEPFLTLSKSATSPRAAAELVQRATCAPNTYLFAELLQTPQVQALACSRDHSPYLALLRIFSHGTYGDYTAQASSLPSLNDAQRLKLRQLSLLTLVRQPAGGSSSYAGSPTSYANLQQALGLDNARDLEALVISAVYAGLIKAQLDPVRGMVQMHSVSALRDIGDGPEAINSLLESLQQWEGRMDATLSSLDAEMAALRSGANCRAAEADAWKDRMARLTEEELKRNSSGHEQQNSYGTRGKLGLVGGNSFLSGASGAFGAATQNFKPRFGKRAIGHTDGRDDDTADDEAMDLDEEEEDADGKKRASRRKL